MPLPLHGFVVGESLRDNPHLLDFLHRDERLSQSAHGLLLVALGYPQGQLLTPGLLHTHHTFTSEEFISGILEELRACGYLRLTDIGSAFGQETFTLYGRTALAEAVVGAQLVFFPQEVEEEVAA